MERKRLANDLRGSRIATKASSPRLADPFILPILITKILRGL
jgi:hypothetical protein